MSPASKKMVDAYTLEQGMVASDPHNSAWVSANAGSGKTFVLTKRVVRLLLDGNDPSRLLCLTFTKAAAGEMANRVFEALGEWAVMPDDELKEALTEVEGRIPTDEQLCLARTLFAKALETPGGLKIQTIHAFCEALLHQFPLEANVPGSFTVMDESHQTGLLQQARRQTWLKAGQEPASDLGRAFIQVTDAASDVALEKAVEEIIGERDELGPWLAKVGGPVAATAMTLESLGFAADETIEQLENRAADESLLSRAEWQELHDVAAATDESVAREIAKTAKLVLSAQRAAERLSAISSIVMTKDRKVRSFSRYPSKAIVAALPSIRESLEREAYRLEAALDRIATLRLIKITEPLLVLAEAILANYRETKQRLGLLDFDDLVERTADLLSRSDARQWVLYKLDLGIDHVLLDEAQDTSPRQWQVVASLVEEFFAGISARAKNRTIFVVGDEKQSIYSFQGAEPASFDWHNKKFARDAADAGQQLNAARLNLSFRSTPDVLAAVDQVFENPQNQTGVAFGSGYQNHVPQRKNDPGSVEVWPLVRAENTDDPDEWATPVDPGTMRHQAVRLADIMADDIAQKVRVGRLEASGARIRERDIIVLVRARDRFGSALTRALKERHIAVAGADRLAITDHIAVLDLLALGQVMLTPQDDLSLAALLKSPLFGVDEETLLRLSRHRLVGKREGSLYEAIGSLAGEGPFGRIYDTLRKWMGRVDRQPVYEFYAQLLGADGGRRKFYGRLGAEAEDVIDAFLDIALAHERSSLPGMQAFLSKLAQERPQIKREMDHSSREVRIMTVHAAKGLEAPIVYLVDKCSAAFQDAHAPALYRWGDDERFGYLWVPTKGWHGDATKPLYDAQRARAEDEYRRLLYVAMTRARDSLIVCGYCGDRAPPDPNWYAMVKRALEENGVEISNGLGFRWKAPDSPKARPVHHDDEAATKASSVRPLPPWIGHKLPAESGLPRPLSPSGAQALIDEGAARERVVPSLLDDVDADDLSFSPAMVGTVLHRLLQALPESEPADRWEQAKKFLERSLPSVPDEKRAALLAGVRLTFESDAFTELFDAARSNAEVAVMGRIDLSSGPRMVSGTIDRMVILEDRIVIADFKTSAQVPQNLGQISPDYVTQMALYRKLVAQLYPDKSVEAMLIWTHALDGPKAFILPEDSLNAAYERIAVL